MKGLKNSITLLGCLLLPLIVGGISGYFTAQNIPTWYVHLNKPSFNPPNYLFAPVWTTLYILMGISFYMIIKQDIVDKKLVRIFFIQLILNFAWSFIFFQFHALGLAFIEIVLMWISILTMIISFYKVNKLAGLMNVPYLLWVSFASILNLSIYMLN
jgi:tryptophan-rich sensory protein